MISINFIKKVIITLAIYAIVCNTKDYILYSQLKMDSQLLPITLPYVIATILYLIAMCRLQFNAILTCCVLIICEYFLIHQLCFVIYFILILYILPGMFHVTMTYNGIIIDNINHKSKVTFLVGTLSVLACHHLVEYTYSLSTQIYPVVLIGVFCVLLLTILSSIITKHKVLCQVFIYLVIYLATKASVIIDEYKVEDQYVYINNPTEVVYIPKLFTGYSSINRTFDVYYIYLCLRSLKCKDRYHFLLTNNILIFDDEKYK